MLRGTICITGNPRQCFEMSQSIPNAKILSLDEDNSYQELSPVYNNNVIMGTILLPNMEIQWAELDGDVQAYNALYSELLFSKPVCGLVYTLITYLYLGGNIIIFYPEFDPSGMDNSNNIQFILNYFESGYGIHICTGETDAFRFDPNCIPMYLLGMYNLETIDYMTFLLNYPLDAIIPNEVYYRIILDSSIYGSSIEDKIVYINILRNSLHLSGGKRKAIIHSI